MNPTTPPIGEGSRILHFLIDTILITFLAYFLYKWYDFYVFYWDFKPFQYGYFFFGFTWVYTFLFEWIFLQTPAKMITGTKVVSYDGKRPNIGQFLIRATLRTTIISMFGLAWNDQPFHDTFSKTRLIKKSN
ncbi:MAG: RDD family protein [Chitinophagia bacterium]|jgi:uncharacterized RDD family membrane protein YckC